MERAARRRCCRCCCTRVRFHGGRPLTPDWRLPKSTRHVLAPGVPRRQLVQDPRGATCGTSCPSALHHAAVDALPSRGRGYNPCSGQRMGLGLPLSSFFAPTRIAGKNLFPPSLSSLPPGQRSRSPDEPAVDAWTETVSMTGSSAECPLSGVDHHSSTATTVTFVNGCAKDVHLFWVVPGGERIWYKTLQSGEELVQSTSVSPGHCPSRLSCIRSGWVGTARPGQRWRGS